MLSSALAASVPPRLTVRSLAATLRNTGGTMSVVTGAGVSTESGLPDYRGEHGLYRQTVGISGGQRGAPPRGVILHADFVTNEELRRRYWARSMAGFERFASARPNRAHRDLARLERAGWVVGVVTQNVDRLHTEAGSTNVVELHGRGDLVKCMDCAWEFPRREFVAMLVRDNAELAHEIQAVAGRARPDFDADLPEDVLSARSLARMRLPHCPRCSGAVLKPSFVFFGGTVDPRVSAAAIELVVSAPVLLVIGTTAETYSARSKVLEAKSRGVSVAVINRGPTRVDELADLGTFAEASLGEFLEGMCLELGLSPEPQN